MSVHASSAGSPKHGVTVRGSLLLDCALSEYMLLFRKLLYMLEERGKLWEFELAPDGLKLSAVQLGFPALKVLSQVVMRLLVAHHRHLKDSPVNSEHIEVHQNLGDFVHY
jgi:hypothetical protein